VRSRSPFLNIAPLTIGNKSPSRWRARINLHNFVW